jgi:hypothetical protein
MPDLALGNIQANTIVPAVAGNINYSVTMANVATYVNSTITTVSVTGNITGGNIRTAGLVNATGNVTGGNIRTVGQVTATGNITGAFFVGNGSALTGLPATYGNANVAANLAAFGTNPISTTGSITAGTGSFSGNVNLNSKLIQNLLDPLADQDAATKAYVDSVAQGLDPKASCIAATTANITLSGTQTIDGIAVIVGNRVLVKNQTAPAENGIYVVASSTWSRSTDMDNWSEVPGAFVFIESGTTQASSGWVTTVTGAGVINVTAMPWTQFSGAGSYSAGTGLTLTGSTFSVNASQPQVTTLGTLGSLAVSGTITGGNVVSGTRVSAANYAESVYTIGSTSGTITPNINNGAIQSMTLTGSITLNAITNIATGQGATFIITQGGTGSYTLTSGWLFAGGSKTLSTTVGAVDIISVFYSGTVYYASLTKGYA